MGTHLEEKVEALVQQHVGLVQKRILAEGRRKEAVALEREAAAQHLAIEISVITADMQDINAQVKELQRQGYFLSIERNRSPLSLWCRGPGPSFARVISWRLH